MPTIPSSFNGVDVDFAATVNKEVDQALIDALELAIKPDIASGHILQTIYISSASDSHSMPSRHAQSKAVDISRINGKKMSIYYQTDAEVHQITNAIQDALESAPSRRENFGPYFKHKSGNPYSVGGHGDHIHFSVD